MYSKYINYSKTQVRYKMSCTYIYIDFERNFMYRL